MYFINLVPYRDELKEKRKKIFIVKSAAVVLAFGAFYFGVYHDFEHRMQYEKDKLTYLKGVESQLSAKVKSLKNLENEKSRLIARENIIQKLQDERAWSVKLFNGISNAVPKGVFLTQIQENNGSISLTGYAQGNAQVAQFMRNIKKESIFSNPDLVIVSSSELQNNPVKYFVVRTKIQYEVKKKPKDSNTDKHQENTNKGK